MLCLSRREDEDQILRRVRAGNFRCGIVHSTATTVRARNGKVSTTNGSFAETNEQAARFYLVDAK